MVATNLGGWDYTAQVALGGFIHEQLAEVKSGRLSLDVSSAVLRTPATVTPDTVVAEHQPPTTKKARRDQARRTRGRHSPHPVWFNDHDKGGGGVGAAGAETN